LMDSAGNWMTNNKHGVGSKEEFLASPRAQEAALQDMLIDDWGTFMRAFETNRGRSVEEFLDAPIRIQLDGGATDTFTISQDNVLAAIHNKGPIATAAFLNRLQWKDGAWEADRTVATESDRTKELIQRMRVFDGVQLWNDDLPRNASRRP
jgi:hypothetical protein